MMKGQEHLSVQKGLKSLWVYVTIPEVREDGFHTEYLQHWKANQQNMNKATDVSWFILNLLHTWKQELNMENE